VFLAQVLNCVLPVDCREMPDETVSVPGGDAAAAIPARTTLHANVPNPFNPVTTIEFDLARDGHVSLRVYDAAGRLVRTLVDRKMSAGAGQQAAWNGLTDAGNRVSSGVYFYRLMTADFDGTRKMVLMK
jgi:flagellar hook assembly protein FlgD